MFTLPVFDTSTPEQRNICIFVSGVFFIETFICLFFWFVKRQERNEYISHEQNEMGHFNLANGEFACRKRRFFFFFPHFFFFFFFFFLLARDIESSFGRMEGQTWTRERPKNIARRLSTRRFHPGSVRAIIDYKKGG